MHGPVAPVAVTFLSILLALPAGADWPVLGGDPTHRGAAPAAAAPAGPCKLAWARHFKNERFGSAFEPIVAGGKVFVSTHAGSLYALDAATGDAVWRVAFPGAILHSPAFHDGKVIAADATGRVAVLDAAHGTLVREHSLDPAGFAGAPLVVNDVAVLASRGGEVYAVDVKGGDVKGGDVKWKATLGAPVRQTPTFGGTSGVFVTAEDLRVRRLDVADGTVTWTSEPLAGQTARDYYPVAVTGAKGRGYVVVRTNPSTQFSRQLSRDRELLCKTAGVDPGDWKKTEAWIADPRSAGTPEQFAKEQDAVEQYLKDDPSARTFFVLDAATGKEAQVAPVLWAAGCQGVGAPPAVAPDGRLLVYYRSAYGNWNHGVAPFVALGLYDLSTNRIEPLRHSMGPKPPWNTFWGTADESQHFQWAGGVLLIVHQSTVSAFDPSGGKLTTLFGERDSWGGFRNLPWARNEWNGPGRGGVALDGAGRAYWATGSRVLCLEAGARARGTPADVAIDAAAVPAPAKLAAAEPAAAAALKGVLASSVDEVLARPWAPLYVEPGLAGREFFFDDSGELFRAMAMAFPQLPPATQQRVRDRLTAEWAEHPPFDRRTWYARDGGDRREWFVPVRKDAAADAVDTSKPPFHPFGNVYAVWLYAERCGEWGRVIEAKAALQAAFDDFAKSNWHLDPAKGDVNANRYLASLIAYQRIADRAGDASAAAAAGRLAEQVTASLLAWWREAAATGVSTPVIKDITAFDRFLGHGDALFHVGPPHRAKLALFHGLTPEVARVVRDGAGDAPQRVWSTFVTLCPTWNLVGEERQVHYGENLYDPPDFALDAFAALAWLNAADGPTLRSRVDQPWCRADLYHVMKIAAALEQ